MKQQGLVFRVLFEKQVAKRKKGKEGVQSNAGEDNFVDRGLESPCVLDSTSVSCENYNNI